MSIASRTRNRNNNSNEIGAGSAESAEPTTRLSLTRTTARRRRSRSTSRRCSRSSRRCSLQTLDIVDPDASTSEGDGPAESSVESDGSAKSLTLSNKPLRRSKRIESKPEISYSESKKRSGKSSKSASKSTRPKPKRDQSERCDKTNDDINEAHRATLQVKVTTGPTRNDSPTKSVTFRPVSPTPSSSDDDEDVVYPSCATPKTARARRRSITFGEGELAEYECWESPSTIKRLGPCSIADFVDLPSEEEEEELQGETEVRGNFLANPYVVTTRLNRLSAHWAAIYCQVKK